MQKNNSASITFRSKKDRFPDIRILEPTVVNIKSPTGVFIPWITLMSEKLGRKSHPATHLAFTSNSKASVLRDAGFKSIYASKTNSDSSNEKHVHEVRRFVRPKSEAKYFDLSVV